MKVLLACGGTGGHLFPGIALAEAFEERIRGIEIVFVGTPKGIEKNVLDKTKWRLELMSIPTFANKQGFKKIFSGFSFLKALIGAMRLIRKEKPSLVVGVGGYVAAPILLMASLLQIPTLTIEPNAIPGLANRFLKPFVKKIVVAYPEAQKQFGKKALLLGVPVRNNLLAGSGGPRTADRKKVVFLFGGSLGAKTINEGIVHALPYLKHWKDQIHFVHQVGAKGDPVALQKSYEAQGFSAEVYPFIEKMGEFYAKADLVVARSGANTVAELAAVQKPSILIPYPYSQAGHQEANAHFLEKAGGARVLLDSQVSGEILANFIEELLSKPEKLEAMRTSLAGLHGTEASKKIVEVCLKLISYV